MTLIQQPQNGCLESEISNMRMCICFKIVKIIINVTKRICDNVFLQFEHPFIITDTLKSFHFQQKIIFIFFCIRKKKVLDSRKFRGFWCIFMFWDVLNMMWPFLENISWCECQFTSNTRNVRKYFIFSWALRKINLKISTLKAYSTLFITIFL